MFAAIVGQSWADDAHPYNLEVNGTDLIASCSYPSIAIEMAGPGTNGSLRFRLSDPTAAITIAEWDEVRFIEHAATRPILFGGFVQSVRYLAWATTGREIEVECVGYGILLDRKVVDAFDVTSFEDAPDYLGGAWVALVNRFGGRVTALQTETVYADTDETWTVSHYGTWVPSVTSGAATTAITTGSLRSACEYLAEQSADSEEIVAAIEGGWVLGQVGAVYWVDAYARLHAHPRRVVQTPTYDSNTYDGTCPVEISETTGAGKVRASSIEWEREDPDRLTRPYVEGGNALGSGWTGFGGLERAGDLEDVISRPESTTESQRRSFARGAVEASQPSAVRSTITVVSATTIDFRPGQKLTVSNTQLGLSSAEYRIAGVSIAFQTATYRVYSISAGGSAPSMANRSGRYATI